MSTQNLKIAAEARQPGKSSARALRSNRAVPAVVYGPKTKPISFSIGINDATKYAARRYENTIFTLESKDSALNGLKILRKSLDIHPLSRNPIHLDFFAPDMTQAVRVAVEVRLTGKAAGTAEGGLVTVVRRDVEIECLPLEIPEAFTLDISPLGLNESMHVSDIQFPEGLKIITSLEETLVTCSEVKEEVIAAPVAAEGAAAAGAEGAAAPGAAPAAGAAPASGAAAPAGEKKK